MLLSEGLDAGVSCQVTDKAAVHQVLSAKLQWWLTRMTCMTSYTCRQPLQFDAQNLVYRAASLVTWHFITPQMHTRQDYQAG